MKGKRLKINNLGGLIFLVIFSVLIATFLVGIALDKAGGVGNYVVKLQSTPEGWVCHLTVVNESQNRFRGGLSKITLNGQPTSTSISNFRVEPGQTKTFPLKFPKDAAKPDSISTLYCWVENSQFGSWSNTLQSFEIYPDDAQGTGGLGKLPESNPSDPFLQIFPSKRGWVCRFTFRNNESAPITYSVERCWLNGKEAIQSPSNWNLLPGQWIARDIVFPPDAAQSGVPAKFNGYYQIYRGRRYYDLRPYKATLHP